MLLSLLASYKWFGKRSYILKLGIVIASASLFSAVFAQNSFSFVLGPLPLLSFPFYGFHDEVFGFPAPGEEGRWTRYYEIHCLAIPIYSVFPAGWRVYQVSFLSTDLGRFSTWPPTFLTDFYLDCLPFLFFLFVNFVGGVCGFLLARQRKEKKMEAEKQHISGFTWQLILGIITIVTGLGLFKLGVDGLASGGYRWIIDGSAFLMFGATWIFVILLTRRSSAL